MSEPFSPRRLALGAAKKLFIDQPVSKATEPEHFAAPRLTPAAILEKNRMSRPRDRILNNLEEMYREAFERAKASDDPSAQTSLDFAYRREQLYFEVLLDVRDALERR